MAHDTAAASHEMTAAVLDVRPAKHVLDGVIVRAVTWIGGIKGVTHLVTWACTIILARILSPQDYGLVAMATVYLGLTTMVTDFGLGGAIIALPELGEALAAQLHAAAALVGIAALVVSCLLAAPLSWFFNTPALTSVVMVLSSILVFESFRVVPMAMLARQLRYKEIALLDGLKAVLIVGFALPLAASGSGHWALVLGNVVAALVLTVVVLVRFPQRLVRPKLRDIKPTLKFSSHFMTAQLAWYGYTNADFVIAGRVLGRTALGEYTLAWTLISAPGDKLMAIFGRVIPMVLANVQRDAQALRRYFLLFTEALAIVIIPVSVGLALVARDFVHLVLGAKWAAAVVPLQLLCFFIAIHMLQTPAVRLLQAIGQASLAARSQFLMLAILPPAFYVSGSRWGTVGIAAVWLAVYPLLLVPVFWRAFRTLEIRLSEYFACLAPTLLSAALMTAVVLTIRIFAPSTWPLAVDFAVQTAGGAAAFLATAFFLQRHRLGALADVVRAIRN